MSVNVDDLRLVLDFLESRRALIVGLQESKGIKASGESAAALSVERTLTGGQLVVGAGTFVYQEFGRGPGKLPPWSNIYAWLALKKYGLTWSTEAQRRALAWRIANKIKHQGTRTFIRRKPTGVLSEAISDEDIAPLLEELANRAAARVSTDLFNFLAA